MLNKWKNTEAELQMISFSNPFSVITKRYYLSPSVWKIADDTGVMFPLVILTLSSFVKLNIFPLLQMSNSEVLKKIENSLSTGNFISLQFSLRNVKTLAPVIVLSASALGENHNAVSKQILQQKTQKCWSA